MRLPCVLILVLSTNQDPWRRIEWEGQRATWASGEEPLAPTEFYYGHTRAPSFHVARAALKATKPWPKLRRRLAARYTDRDEAVLRGDRLFVDVPDVGALLGAKTLVAFRHALAHREFDYIFRTNTSTYVDRPSLLRWAAGMPRERCYGGFLGERDGVQYTSGTGTLLSRDLIGRVVADEEWDPTRVDDLELGHSMMRVGVKPIPAPRLETKEPEDVAALDDATLRKHFHVRCRSTGDRSRDIEVMHCLHQRFLALQRE